MFAQEWIEFANREDRFTCNFPSQPKVTETTYRSEHGADLPARVYSAAQGQSRYSVTVVDYNQAQRLLTEKAKACPAGAEPCLGSPGDEGHWKADVRGAIVYASWRLMQRDAKLTSFVWNFVDLVEGHQLQLTNNADKSRTFAGIYMRKLIKHLPRIFHVNWFRKDDNGNSFGRVRREHARAQMDCRPLPRPGGCGRKPLGWVPFASDFDLEGLKASLRTSSRRHSDRLRGLAAAKSSSGRTVHEALFPPAQGTDFPTRAARIPVIAAHFSSPDGFRIQAEG